MLLYQDFSHFHIFTAPIAPSLIAFLEFDTFMIKLLVTAFQVVDKIAHISTLTEKGELRTFWQSTMVIFSIRTLFVYLAVHMNPTSPYLEF